MNGKFNPNNGIIKLCMVGMSLADSGKTEEAGLTFDKAWQAAADDYEKFIAAYYLARQQERPDLQLKWLETALQCALKIDDEDVKSAYPTLYASIAKCYEALEDWVNAKANWERGESYKGEPTDKGPFYHGTRADLKVGDFLTAGGVSNYKDELQMNHIYFTANIHGAGLAAALAKGTERERIYLVEPTGAFENDPNVTDQKFPGNLTRSYRSEKPLKIIGEVTEWLKLTAAEKSEWQKKIAENEGEIIN